jgi:hypothetical protein
MLLLALLFLNCVKGHCPEGQAIRDPERNTGTFSAVHREGLIEMTTQIRSLVHQKRKPARIINACRRELGKSAAAQGQRCRFWSCGQPMKCNAAISLMGQSAG